MLLLVPIMKWCRALSLSVILLNVVVLPSFAGSAYVEDSYRLRKIFNGESTTKVKIKEIYTGIREADSYAVKREWGSTVAIEAKDGRNFYENDRFNITTKSSAQERGNVRKVTNVNVIESYEFSGFNKSHRVTSGFDF